MIGKHLNYNLGVGSCGEAIQVIQDLSSKGQNNSIYYNQSDGKYYSYTDLNGYKMISGNSNESFKYLVTPSFFGECNYNINDPDYPDIFLTTIFDDYEDGKLNNLSLYIDSRLENFRVLKQGVTLGFCSQDIDEVIPEFYENNSSFDVEYLPDEGFFGNFSDLKYNFNHLNEKLYNECLNRFNKTGETVINNSKIIEVILLNEVSGKGKETLYIPIKYRIKVEYVFAENAIMFIRLTIIGVEYSSEFIFDISLLNIKYTLIDLGLDIKMNGTYYNTYVLSIIPMGYRLGDYTVSNVGLSGLLTYFHNISNSGFAYYGDFNRINYEGTAQGGGISLGFSKKCNALTILSEISIGNEAFDIFDLPLFNMLDICGYFQAAQNDITITLPASIKPADNNPEIIKDHNYEYHIMFSRFILIDITNTPS